MATLDEENAKLERQRAYFASDDRIREEIALWADATSQERLAELVAMCRGSQKLVDSRSDEHLERMRRTSDFPADTIAILERLRRPR